MVAEGMTILIADDDAQDCMMTERALAASRGADDLRFVGDGEALIDYLMRRGEYADPLTSPRPDIILLDLNMPKKDGYAALEEIKATRGFGHLIVRYHVERGGGHQTQLRPRGELVHYKARDVSRPGRSNEVLRRVLDGDRHATETAER
jgi:CheY-like chemotaxis protein